MKRRRRSDRELLDLLRKSLSADLPPDVEVQLREEFARFRGRLRIAGDVRESPVEVRSSRGLAWTGWRVAAAVAALMIAILGATLEPIGATSGFGAPLELWQQRARVLSNLSRVVVMEARIEGRDPAGHPVTGLVWWLSAQPTRMERPEVGESARHALNAARLSLGPRELIRTLGGGWRVGSRRGTEAAREFVVQPPGSSREILVAIDPAGDLPVSVADPAGDVVVYFRWTMRFRDASVLLHRMDRR